MTGGMAFIYDVSKEFEKKVNSETVVWQNIETDYWKNYLQKLVLEHSKETNSELSKKSFITLRQKLRILFRYVQKK